MSFSLITPCWNCETKENCKDSQHIQEGINAAHQDPEGHKGTGTVVVSCARCKARS